MSRRPTALMPPPRKPQATRKFTVLLRKEHMLALGSNDVEIVIGWVEAAGRAGGRVGIALRDDCVSGIGER